jgi:multiple sugar transport system permease protein
VAVVAAPTESTAQSPPAGRPGLGTGTRRRNLMGGVLFLTPFLVPFILFYLVPIGYAIWQSFQKVQRVGGTFGRPENVFAGFEQYANVFQDEAFRKSVVRVATFGLVQVPIMLGLALLLALLLDSNLVKAKKFFRIAFFLPYAIPGVLAALMWAFLYQPSLSPIIDLFDKVATPPDLLGPDLILWSIANVVTWTYAGYNMLIIYSALQAIPQDIYEAARLDGANNWKIAWTIKVPIVRPAIILTAVFSIIGTLQLFTEPQVFKSISTNVTSTYTPNLAAFTAASANNYSYAAATSVVLAVATFILSFLFLKVTQRRAEL